MIKSKVEKIVFTDTRPDFDRACENAYSNAISIWQIDDCGHCQKLPNFPRSESSIHVKFIGYESLGGMGGITHIYMFETWMERCDNEDEE